MLVGGRPKVRELLLGGRAAGREGCWEGGLSERDVAKGRPKMREYCLE
jgi:hypothetical protein